MPKRYARMLLLSLLPGLALAGPAEAELAQRLDALLAAHPDFSGELLLAQGKQTLYQRSQTPAERSDAPPPDRPYQYRVGSISKQLTAVLVLRAAATGQLDLDQALGSDLTGLPARTTRSASRSCSTTAPALSSRASHHSSRRVAALRMPTMAMCCWASG